MNRESSGPKPLLLECLWVFLAIVPLSSLAGGTGKEKPVNSGKESTGLNISGELFIDQRIALNNRREWVWNENRLSCKMKKIQGETVRFYGEVWLRNFGVPRPGSVSALYDKGNADPVQAEIREANIQISGFPFKRSDLRIGRQRLAWGTADRLNPTDILNPYDLEDILDFGRHRGSDALSFVYYFNDVFSLQAAYIPVFRPANLPVGIFSGIFESPAVLPGGFPVISYSDTLNFPQMRQFKDATYGIRLKGLAGNVDFSVSYARAYDGLPLVSENRIFPATGQYGVHIQSTLSFLRNHMIGADMATSIGGAGFWVEGALFIPEENFIMRTDLSSLYPQSPVSLISDSLIVCTSQPVLKFIAGMDYHFRNSTYLNLQYLHGFIHEKTRNDLNHYLLIRFEKRMFNDRLNLAPLSGAFVFSSLNRLKNQYALVWMPQITYSLAGTTDISLSGIIFHGEGNTVFSGLKRRDMLRFTLNYFF